MNDREDAVSPITATFKPDVDNLVAERLRGVRA